MADVEGLQWGVGRSHCRFTLRRKPLLTAGDQISKCLRSGSTSVARHSPHGKKTHTHKKKWRLNTALVRVEILEISHLVSSKQRRNNNSVTPVPWNEAWRVNTRPGRAFQSSATVSSLPRPPSTPPPPDRCRWRGFWVMLWVFWGRFWSGMARYAQSEVSSFFFPSLP